MRGYKAKKIRSSKTRTRLLPHWFVPTDHISAMQSSDAMLSARSKQFKAMSNCAA